MQHSFMAASHGILQAVPDKHTAFSANCGELLKSVGSDVGSKVGADVGTAVGAVVAWQALRRRGIGTKPSKHLHLYE